MYKSDNWVLLDPLLPFLRKSNKQWLVTKLKRAGAIRSKVENNKTYVNEEDLNNAICPDRGRCDTNLLHKRELESRIIKNIKAICQVQKISQKEMEEVTGSFKNGISVVQLLQVAYLTETAVEDIIYMKYYE